MTIIPFKNSPDHNYIHFICRNKHKITETKKESGIPSKLKQIAVEPNEKKGPHLNLLKAINIYI